MLRSMVSCIVLMVGMALAPPSLADGAGNLGRSCAAKAKGTYGFQCHGSAFNGASFDQVTFVGVVKGDIKSVWEGFGSFNSGLGTVSTRFSGPATYGPACFGRVTYSTFEIVLPGGGTVPLPPALFDFIAVDDSNEILGTGVAPGMTGDFVPRLTCRLVRI